MRQTLVETQAAEGCAAGSWDPLQPTPDAFGKRDGRLLTTCFSALALAARYRYLPPNPATESEP